MEVKVFYYKIRNNLRPTLRILEKDRNRIVLFFVLIFGLYNDIYVLFTLINKILRRTFVINVVKNIKICNM